MSDSFLEYAGVPPGRFDLWQNVLRDVGFARGYGPAHGLPGYSEYQRQAAQAIDLLWPHLELLPRHVDPRDPHIAAQLESIRRAIESSRNPTKERRVGDVSLDLSWVMDSLEVLLLGLIGSEGQSPVAPRRAEIPLQSFLPAWLVLATGCPNLLPGPAATQTVSWRTPRAYLLPSQMRDLLELPPREVSPEECRTLIESWNAHAEIKLWVGTLDRAQRDHYAACQARFREVWEQLRSDLKGHAQRGEIYVGWTAWYGYE